MGQYSKEFAIYLSLFLCCTPYTMIATFYPGIAQSSGLELWLIGLVFSADPISALFTSVILGKFMFKIGRKETIIIGLVLCALSMFALCPIQYLKHDALICISILSRVLAGASAGCIMVAADSIVVSDYPDQIDLMIGRLEGAIGVGLIVGPLVGLILVLAPLFYSLVAFGFVILAFVPVCNKMLGKFREYVIENHEISSIQLLVKPVLFIQKISLDLGLNFILLFSFGFIIPALELHLLKVGLGRIWIPSFFVLHTASYSVFSIFGSKIFSSWDYRSVLCGGLGMMFVGFIMLGPWELIFPQSVWVILGSLPILGMGQAMIYSNIYSVPTYPHLIQIANESYGYEKDDILSDSISSLSNISCNLGEIVGPVITGLLIGFIGFEETSTYIAFSCLLYSLAYFVASGLMGKWMSKKSGDLSRKILPEESLSNINKSI